MYCGNITVTVAHPCVLIYYKSGLTGEELAAINPKPQKGKWV